MERESGRKQNGEKVKTEGKLRWRKWRIVETEPKKYKYGRREGIMEVGKRREEERGKEGGIIKVSRMDY